MKRAWLVAAAFSVWAACGGTVSGVSPDCPKSGLGRGVACTMNGSSCPYTLVSVDCFGGRSETPSSCTCTNGIWDCPEVGPQPCPMMDGGSIKDSGPSTDGGMTDPGSVTCNGMPCAVPANYCCDQGMFPNPGMQTCVPSSTSSCAGLRRACDETADCIQGSVCCIPPNAAQALAYNAECVPASNCNGSDPYAYRMCKSSSECPMGVTCVTQPCQGYTISTCGGIPAQRCQ